MDDACGLYYDSTEWTALGYDYVWTVADSDGSYGAEMSIADFKPSHGVSCTVELPPQLDASTTISCQMELVKNENTGNDNVPVYFEYDHTWAWLADDSFADIFVEVMTLP